MKRKNMLRRILSSVLALGMIMVLAYVPVQVKAAEVSLELFGANTISSGDFSATGGTATVSIGGTKYSGNEQIMAVPDLETEIVVALTADEGKVGVLRTGGNSGLTIPGNAVNTEGQVTTYTFTLKSLGATENTTFVSLSMEFTDNTQGGTGGTTVPATVNVTDTNNVIGDLKIDNARVDLQNHQVTVPVTNSTRTVSIIGQPGFAIKKVTINETQYSNLSASGDGWITISNVAKSTSSPESYNISIDEYERTEFTIWWSYNPNDAGQGIYVANGKVEVVSVNGQAPDWNPPNAYGTGGGYLVVPKGATIILKLIPNYGYQVGSLTINDTTFTPGSNECEFKLPAVAGDLHLSGAFVKASDKIVAPEDYSSATIANGQNATDHGNLKLTIAESQTTEDMSTVVAGSESVQTLNMGLDRIVSKGTSGGVSQGDWTTPISEFTNNITVTIPITDTTGLSDGQTYGIVREHNGQKEELTATYNASAKTLTFLTNKFSKYTIIKCDAATAPTIPVAPTTPTTPPDTPSEKTESSSSTTNTSATNTTASTTATVTDVTKSTENFQGAALAETPAELLANVLTVEDQALVSKGIGVKVWIDAKDISATVPADQLALVVNSLPEKYEVAKYLDINLFKQVGNNASTKVTQLPNGNVAIRFVLPEDLRKDGRQYKVVRIHDGVATVLDATYDPATGFISFETNQFSTYAIIYTDSATNTKSPKTNNGVDFGAMLAVLLLCASFVYMVKRRKRA